jgi:sec-independent protein translocase protein TatB
VDGFMGINGWEFLVLLLIAMFIFGPDRLPKAIADGVKMLRNLRDMARNATGDLSRELGTDISLEDLNPKTLIRKHILSEEDEHALRKPLEDLYRDVESDVRGVRGDLTRVRGDVRDVAHDLDVRHKPVSNGGPSPVTPAPAPAVGASAYQFDDDAT